MSYQHGNTGKRNAAKESPKTARLAIRVKDGELAQWREAAAEAGVSLAEWVRRTLNG